MIEAGCYVLHIICDGAHFWPGTRAPNAKRSEYIGQTKTEVYADLRRDGWVLCQDGRTFCSQKCYRAHEFPKPKKETP